MLALIETLQFVGSLIGKMLDQNKEKRHETAKTFATLSKTFTAFSPAYEEKDFNKMSKLEAKTRGQLDALKSISSFVDVLGNEDAVRFFAAIEDVANAKGLLSLKGEEGRNHLNLVIKAAGYFEGYAEILDPDLQL